MLKPEVKEAIQGLDRHATLKVGRIIQARDKAKNSSSPSPTTEQNLKTK